MFWLDKEAQFWSEEARIFPTACPKDSQKYRIHKGKLGWKSTETARAVS